MEHLTEWRLTGWLFLIGGMVFWIGAFTPPYKQWMHLLFMVTGVVILLKLKT